MKKYVFYQQNEIFVIYLGQKVLHICNVNNKKAARTIIPKTGKAPKTDFLRN